MAYNVRSDTKTAKQSIRKEHTPPRDKRDGIGAKTFLRTAWPQPIPSRFSFTLKG